MFLPHTGNNTNTPYYCNLTQRRPGVLANPFRLCSSFFFNSDYHLAFGIVSVDHRRQG